MWYANFNALVYNRLKQPLGMTSIFVFRFLQIFLIIISMKPLKTQTNFLYT